MTVGEGVGHFGGKSIQLLKYNRSWDGGKNIIKNGLNKDKASAIARFAIYKI